MRTPSRSSLPHRGLRTIERVGHGAGDPKHRGAAGDGDFNSRAERGAMRSLVVVAGAVALLVTVTTIASFGQSGQGGGDGILAANPAVRVIGWNNLGMHCEDDDFSVFSLLPPYNTLAAQVVVNGKRLTNPIGYSVTYEAVADPTGSVNKTSQGKLNFWQYVFALFGASLAQDQGLAGSNMPGAANVPQAMTFDPSLVAFIAEGIPITPYDDAGGKNFYPMMRVTVRDAGGQFLASTDVVLPVSDELSCAACHGTGASAAAMPPSGWENDPDPVLDYRLNVLRIHDDLQASNPAYPGLLAAAGYNAGGLHASVKIDAKPILCAACHASNALPGTGLPGVKPLTEAIHGIHAQVTDPKTMLPLDDVVNRNACYTCHPGSETRCLRGAMGKAVALDGTLEMQCQSCHGSMSKVGTPGRVGWLDEPSCQSCHTGTAVKNSGQIRFTSAFDAQGKWRVAADQTFATNPNTPAPGFSLYRFSSGHGGLQCEACHGATHAEYPSLHPNDNVQSVQLQGHVGVLAECTTCHGSSPATVTGGPHGMHPLGQSWVSAHGDVAEEGGANACRACHGTDYKSTVLSRALGPRTLSSGFGTKNLWRGFQVSCYLCHNGPNSESKTSDHAPVVQNTTGTTDDETLLWIPLKATDADNDALALRIVDQPEHGTVGITGKTAKLFPEPGYVGTVSFTFAAFDGKIDSNLGKATITIEAAGCPATVSQGVFDFGASGGMAMFTLTIPDACAWNVTVPPSAKWITIMSAGSGMGSAGMQIHIADNSGPSRHATIVVAGKAVEIFQGGTDSPDFTGAWKSAKASCKTKKGVLRCTVSGALRVENTGFTKAAKSKVTFYLSDDAVLDPGDLQIATRKVGTLKPGHGTKLKLSKTLPAGLASSGKFLIAATDAPDLVLEVDEGNNVAMFGPLP